MSTPSAKKAFVCLLLVALAPAPHARAQFYSPFFDNRPPPPVAIPHRREFRPETRPEVRPRSKKPHVQHVVPRQRRHPAVAKAAPEKPPPPPSPVVEPPPPPYEPQLLRLSEIMGALAVLDSFCGPAGPDKANARSGDAAETADGAKASDGEWRLSMQKLMDSQDAGSLQRERLAGAYNRGLRGYGYFHRQCTPSAALARRRFLDEGGRIAHDIATQYREK
jgi:predicted secreted protein